MKWKKIFITLLVVCQCFLTFGEDDDYSSLFEEFGSSETTSEESPTSPTNSDFSDLGFSAMPEFSLTMSGDHEANFRIPVIPDHFNFNSTYKSPKFRNSLGIEINYRDLKFVSAGRFDAIINNTDNWEEILHIMPLDNYISWSPWKLKFSAGLQTFSWGVADGMNPTDNINPVDYRYGASAEKIPILSAAFSMYPVDFFSFDIVYVPFEQNSFLPIDYNDYIPPELFADFKIAGSFDNPTIETTPTGKTITFGKLNFDPSKFLIGGKTNFHFARVDFSFSYLYDYDEYYTPEVTFRDATIDVDFGFFKKGIPFSAVDDLTLVRKRIHRFGADIKGAVDRFGIWGEFCFNMTEDYLMDNYMLRDHYITFTTGFDCNYGPNDSFYFNFQCVGNVNLNADTDFYKDYPFYDMLVNSKIEDPIKLMSYTNKFSDKEYMKKFYYRAMVGQLGLANQWATLGATINMSWPVLDNLLKPSLTASYMVPIGYDTEYEHRYGCLYVKPALDIMPIDSFHIEIGADLFFSWIEYMSNEGKIEMYNRDMFGIFHKDSSVYLAVKYKWSMDWKK